VVEPWEHGSCFRATRYPTFYDYNALRLEGADPGISAEDLEAVADDALDGLAHRRVDVDDEGAGRRLRADFKGFGYRTGRLLWMRWEAPVPAGAPELEELTAEEVRPLRLEWALHDRWEPDEEATRAFMEVEAEVYARRGARWLVHRGPDGEPVAFVTLLVEGAGAEIALAYCTPEHRGTGIGTSLLLSAVREVRELDDIWIVADDEDRPKGLYQRLGFAPAAVLHEFTRLPPS
jgi:GNAT superfamily N-acetyltransferase